MKKQIFILLLLLFMGFTTFGQSASPSGAFSYSVPIEVPPGTNGMQPNLALVYNSQAGNGMLGMGWSLSGLSVISRDSSYDLDFDDTSDHFILDGQRLIKDESGLYHTQVENYSIIEFNNPGTSSSWTVKTKTGMKMYYGATADSRIEAVGKNGQALMWRLNKVEDVLGNYMTLEYAEDEVNGDSYPIRIEYTMNDTHGLNKTRTVEFFYEEREDHFVQYVPTAMDVDYRLKWVVVKIGGNLLRKYGLDYEGSSQLNQSRLVSLREYGSEGNVPYSASEAWVVDSTFVPIGSYKPSIEFEHTKKVNGFNRNDFHWPDFIGYNATTGGDFNGDGFTDLLLQKETNNGYRSVL
ncbi:MAG: FG-GAP repeat protein, partial [Spirochaetales bacterium]|nr:FG-GAP repeat protein [Spirochaetales bacterium]